MEQLADEVGFTGFEITWKENIYAGAPQESSALEYGTLGITFKANKPRAAFPARSTGDS